MSDFSYHSSYKTIYSQIHIFKLQRPIAIRANVSSQLLVQVAETVEKNEHFYQRNQAFVMII